MKNKFGSSLITFISILLIAGCSSDVELNGEVVNGEEMYYYDDGTLKAKVPVNAEGQKEGIAKYYDEQGNLEKTSNYKNDLLNGEMCTYYPSGQLSNVSNFKNGLGEGSVIEYFENGQVMATGEYSKGMQNGLFVTYYENGNKKFEWIYEQGHRISLVDYERDGSVKAASIKLTAGLKSSPDFSIGNRIPLELQFENRHQNADSTKAMFTFICDTDTIRDTILVEAAIIKYEFTPINSGKYKCVIQGVEWVNPLNDVIFITRDSLYFTVR